MYKKLLRTQLRQHVLEKSLFDVIGNWIMSKNFRRKLLYFVNFHCILIQGVQFLLTKVNVLSTIYQKGKPHLLINEIENRGGVNMLSMIRTNIFVILFFDGLGFINRTQYRRQVRGLRTTNIAEAFDDFLELEPNLKKLQRRRP